MSENFDRVLDIELKVSAVLGRTKIALKDIFELSKGSLIELDTFEGQEVEINVNGRKIGYGQVVIVDENFGVRITRILGEEELVKTIGEYNRQIIIYLPFYFSYFVVYYCLRYYFGFQLDLCLNYYLNLHFHCC